MFNDLGLGVFWKTLRVGFRICGVPIKFVRIFSTVYALITVVHLIGGEFEHATPKYAHGKK